MAATALLRQTPNPTDSESHTAMVNLYRCGTYNAISAAVHQLAGSQSDQKKSRGNVEVAIAADAGGGCCGGSGPALTGAAAYAAVSARRRDTKADATAIATDGE